METAKKILTSLAAIALLLLSLFSSESGFRRVQDFRALERIPLVSIIGSTGGETQLQGEVSAIDSPLQSPRTKSDSVYFRYTIEEKYRDSDGNTRWRTIRDEANAVNFYLRDSSGTATVLGGSDAGVINWSAAHKHRETVGDLRHTEWRIDIGDRVTLYGWLTFVDDTVTLSFREAGKYLPIISSFTGSQERADLGSIAIFWLWGGVSALVLMCFFVVYTLRIHKTLVYLGMITLSSSILLTHYGIMSLESDVSSGAERVDEQRVRTEALIESTLAHYRLPFPGLQQPFDLEQPEYRKLSSVDKNKINILRNTSYQLRERYLDQISRFPERPYAISRGLDNPAPINLPADQLKTATAGAGSFTPTRTETSVWLTALGLILITITAWFAFRQIKTKRMQENIPTSKTAGVSYGIAEVKGELVAENQDNLLIAPISGNACCWYHYVIQERRGSGKNAKWVSITDEIKKQPFLCKDNEGEIRIFPGQAEVFSNHKSERSEGLRRYTETRLEPGDPLYVLGRATADKTTGNTLVFVHDKEVPYIIANKSEQEVMFHKSSRGMFILNFAVSLLFLCALWIGGSNGNFSSVDFILASLIAPAFLLVLMSVIMYNDLVFLKRRCDRNWANIQISLKKRSTLLPRIETVVKANMEHEASLQEHLAELRTSSSNAQTVDDLDKYIAIEHRAINKLLVTLEAYPDLKSGKVVMDFTRRIIKLENEIALIRQGFNDSVMQYNTRIATFPDNLFARPFGFNRLSTLSFDEQVHTIPQY